MNSPWSTMPSPVTGMPLVVAKASAGVNSCSDEKGEPANAASTACTDQRQVCATEALQPRCGRTALFVVLWSARGVEQLLDLGLSESAIEDGDLIQLTLEPI